MPVMVIALVLASIAIPGKPHARPLESEDYVYTVRIPQTVGHEPIIQTGFRLRATKGIITALHGVLGADTLSAFSEKGDVLNHLAISQVDVRNDLALLRSEELVDRPAEGLIVGSSTSVPPAAQLQVWGHPAGINLYRKTVSFGLPPIKTLFQLVPPASAEAFDERMSPATDLLVLNVEGNLVPGDSGAPLLDGEERVIGVVDGGLLGGAAAISWAIPISSISWRDQALAKGRLAQLASLATNNLFAFTTDSTPGGGGIVVSKDGDGQYQTIHEAVGAAQAGARIIVRPGVYQEDGFDIDKSVSIVGEGRREEILLQMMVTVGSNANVVLENVTMRSEMNPIRVYGRVSVKNCAVSGAVPVLVAGGAAMIGKSDLISHPIGESFYISYGIDIERNGSAIIEDSTVSGGRDGGMLVEEGGVLVARNSRITGNTVGVKIDPEGRATISYCDLRNNARGPIVLWKHPNQDAPSGVLAEDHNIK